jgi:hypothetical protein
MRTVLATALVALVVSAGCAGTYRVSEEPPENVTTVAESPTTTETSTSTPTRTTTSVQTLVETTDSEPQKGDQLLSASELNESQALTWNASKRATFDNLSAERQRVVKRAIECDCNVALDGEFSFHDKDRVEVVNYDGTYYFLRVTVV